MDGDIYETPAFLPLTYWSTRCNIKSSLQVVELMCKTDMYLQKEKEEGHAGISTWGSRNEICRDYMGK